MINRSEQAALDRMVGRDGLRATLEAMLQSYELHLRYSGGDDHERMKRLRREKLLLASFATLAKEMTP